MRSILLRFAIALAVAILPWRNLGAADWPTARFDAQRRGASPEGLADALFLQWSRDYPALTPAWPDQPKMEFDEAYHPVVLGQRLFLASSKHDWIAALDTRSGKELWRFFADGPIRFAPLAWEDRVYFVSDDGCLYCLDTAKGSLLWKHRGGPSDRKILGNERLISTWPARGAPVIVDGTLYYGASIWPFMGIFIHAVDARTGKTIWTNDGEGANYIKQPHNADSFATVAPQGYMTAIGDRLLVPGGRSIPALLDRLTGKLLMYQLAENGKKGGGSDVTAAGSFFFNGGAVFGLSTQKHLAQIGSPVAVTRDRIIAHSSGGLRVLDLKLARAKEEEGVDSKGKPTKTTKWAAPERAAGKTGPLEDLIVAGDRVYAAAEGAVLAFDVDESTKTVTLAWNQKIDGTPLRLIAADQRLFVATREGKLLCFGAEKKTPAHHALLRAEAPLPKGDWASVAADHLALAGTREGYALIWRVASSGLVRELHRQSKLKLIVVEPDAARAEDFRKRIVAEDLDRLHVVTGDPASVALPPYLATLVASEDSATEDLSPETLRRWFHCLRPYGGVMVLPASAGFEERTRVAEIAEADSKREGRWIVVRRPRGLPGADNWTHEHADAANTRVSTDALVKAPLGILWFGGPSHDSILPRHGHGPQPQVIDGRLIIEGVDLIRAVDIYTGRLLWETSLPGVGRFFDNLAHQPGANASGGNFVSTAEGIYVAWNDACVRLDLDTGRIVQKFALPPARAPVKGAASVWGYINVAGDYLIGGAEPILDPKLLPPPTKTLKADVGADKDPADKAAKKEGTDPLTRLLKTIRTLNDNMSASKRLVVMDRKTGRVLWSVEAACWFRHNATIAGGGRLFTIDRLSGDQLARYKRKGEDPPVPSRLRAFDLASGKELWSAEADVFGTWLSYSEKRDVLVESGRVARDSLYDEPKGMRAYQGSSGKVLWFDKDYSGPAMIHGDDVLQGQGACDILTGKKKMRLDPISGQATPWAWIRNYGCNTPAASQHLLTFRSGAAGFFDLCNDGGTGNIGGFRSSCTNNLIVAGGVLTAPEYTRTCTCAYQNQTSVALIHMPEAEMWTFFGVKEVKGGVRRLGINFGAPGDRRAADGTLWLEYPLSGGTSPALDIKTRPAKLDCFRRHSSAFAGELPWVAASGVRGLEQLTLGIDKFALGPRKFTVRLHFAEPENLDPGQRRFRVELQDRVVIESLDVAREAGGPRRAIVREFRGVAVHDELFLRLTPAPDSPVPSAILSGMEIIAED